MVKQSRSLSGDFGKDLGGLTLCPSKSQGGRGLSPLLPYPLTLTWARIGVLYGCFARKIEGTWFHHLPGNPSTSPKWTPMLPDFTGCNGPRKCKHGCNLFQGTILSVSESSWPILCSLGLLAIRCIFVGYLSRDLFYRSR